MSHAIRLVGYHLARGHRVIKPYTFILMVKLSETKIDK